MSVFLGEAFEHEGYFVVVTTAPRHGGWWSWVEFQQEIEYGERSVHVPVYRHRVPGAFNTRSESIDAGRQYAHQTLIERTVVFH